jgi:hypothetical protein
VRGDTVFEAGFHRSQSIEENNIYPMTTKLIIPSAAALMLLCSLHTNAQTVVRERTTTVPETTVTAVEPVEAVGTVTEFAPDTVVLRTEKATTPVRYSFAKTIEYVDDAGAPVTREVIKTGTPVTVRYIREGDRMLVNRVIVHRTTAVAPETVTTQKTTTTTTTEEGRRHHDRDKDKDKDKD